MATIRYFWHGFIHRVQHLCTFNIVAPRYLLHSDKCLEGVVHHQRVHLRWCSLLTILQHGYVHLLYVCIFEVLGRVNISGHWGNEWLWMTMMTKWYSGTLGPKASWHLSCRWGKTPKKPHPGNLSRPGIEPKPAAWQARMLPPGPQLFTPSYIVFNFNLAG